jgi:hypothetical protein
MSIVGVTRPIVGGVDTHLDVHVAAAVDLVGGLLGVESFPTTPAGYHDLSSWLSSFGSVERVGVEGTGNYADVGRPDLANAGQDVRLLLTPMSASRRSGRDSNHLPTPVSGFCQGGLAILPHVDVGHADLGDLTGRRRPPGRRCGSRRTEPAVPGTGERGDGCVVRPGRQS